MSGYEQIETLIQLRRWEGVGQLNEQMVINTLRTSLPGNTFSDALMK